MVKFQKLFVALLASACLASGCKRKEIPSAPLDATIRNARKAKLPT